MNQCSDAVWRMATEIMEANKKNDDSAVDAVAEKLQMFSHITQTEGQTLADGEKHRRLAAGWGYLPSNLAPDKQDQCMDTCTRLALVCLLRATGFVSIAAAASAPDFQLSRTITAGCTICLAVCTCFLIRSV